MRFPRVQFKMRALLAVVALAAVLMGAERLLARRDRALALQSSHEIRASGSLRRAESLAEVAARNESEGRRMRGVAHDKRDERFIPFAVACESSAVSQRSEERKLRALAVYHDALRRKYERAARYPWLRIDPDPPPPE